MSIIFQHKILRRRGSNEIKKFKGGYIPKKARNRGGESSSSNVTPRGRKPKAIRKENPIRRKICQTRDGTEPIQQQQARCLQQPKKPPSTIHSAKELFTSRKPQNFPKQSLFGGHTKRGAKLRINPDRTSSPNSSNTNTPNNLTKAITKKHK